MIAAVESKKLSLEKLTTYKHKSRKISMLTCYDYSFACLANNSNIDLLLVGDSGVTTLLGYPDSTHANIEMIELMTKAVSFGAPNKFIVADMPFLSNRKGVNYALECADKLIKAGANAIKIEGISGHEDVIKYIVQSGIPVMGHLGLTPQSVHATGYKVQGKTTSSFELIKQQATHLQEIGCFSMVLECVPSSLGKEISKTVNIPVIGIGAGSDVDGQVLVLQDMLGMTQNLKPKFVRHFLNGAEQIQNSFNEYHSQVQSGAYPNKDESYNLTVK